MKFSKISEKYANDVGFYIEVEECLYSGYSSFQKIDFYKTKTFGTVFTLDDYIMVTEKDEFIYHDMIVHPAFAVNPNIKNVLIIGGGDGGTARELCKYPVKKIDMVEIDQLVVDLCIKHLPKTSGKLRSDNRITLFFEDGVSFIKNCNYGEYDLIIVDSTDPIGPGEGLFTIDFYNGCYKALSEDGILINQHESPFYDVDRKEMLRTHVKIRDIFDIAKVYQFHMPSYASGHWLFGFASKRLHPIRDIKPKVWAEFNVICNYYNTKLHEGAFYLPTYVIRLLKS